MSKSIYHLVHKLGAADESVAAQAAEALLSSPDSLSGDPPVELVMAITRPVGLPSAPILNLARAWSRPEMSRATLRALRQATAPRERERLAWLLKTVLAAEHYPEAIERALEPAESPDVRRWLVEAIERLAFARLVGWDELADVVTMLTISSSPTLRAALPSLLMALPWRSTNTRLLEPLLRDSDPGVVSAAAHTLAGHPEAVRELDPKLLDLLQRHRNPRIRYGATELAAALRQR